MGVFWLALAAFAIGTEAFVIAGLLPVVSADLQISVAATGQLVTAYALAYALGSPILAVAFNNFDRRDVLTLALSGFIAANLLAVASTSFPLLLASRVLMAMGAALCTPTAIGVAVALASPERRGRAVALVTSGITVATVIGVPFGTMVGNQFGWRATFVMVAALGAVALAGVLYGVPRGLPNSTATLGERLWFGRGDRQYARRHARGPIRSPADGCRRSCRHGDGACSAVARAEVHNAGPRPICRAVAGFWLGHRRMGILSGADRQHHPDRPAVLGDRAVAQCFRFVSRFRPRGCRRWHRAVDPGSDRSWLGRRLKRGRVTGSAAVSRPAGTAKTL
jgi:hypothetical protein